MVAQRRPYIRKPIKKHAQTSCYLDNCNSDCGFSIVNLCLLIIQQTFFICATCASHNGYANAAIYPNALSNFGFFALTDIYFKPDTHN
jgi:hypothetical protein